MYNLYQVIHSSCITCSRLYMMTAASTIRRRMEVYIPLNLDQVLHEIYIIWIRLYIAYV